jgi:hypothetical protein
MNSYINSPELIKLTSLVQKGKVVAFVGSGLSGSEYPGWEELIRTICRNCGIDFDKYRVDCDLLELAELARDKDENAYCSTLSGIFGNENVSVPRSYNYLVNTQFNGYVTINFDPLLAEANRVNNKNKTIYSHKKGTDISSWNSEAIYYIHGYVEFGGVIAKDDLILCKSDFDKFYIGDRPRLRPFLEPLFTYRSVLFLGCGLKEKVLQNLLKICGAIKRDFIEDGQVTVPNHYILLPSLFDDTSEKPERDFDAEKIETREYETYGLIVIRYERETETDFLPLTKIIEEWSGLPKPEVISPFNAPELSL